MIDNKRYIMCVLVAQSCLTLCNPMDYSPPGSSVHGILQARILEWGDLPHPGIKLRSPALQADSLPSKPLGKSNYKETDDLMSFTSWCIYYWLSSYFMGICAQKTGCLCTKFGKHSHGYRTGKGQFSFQSPRKAMPKNAQTTAQLHSSHTLVK